MIEKGQKILGIDYGDKRIGLALAEFGSIAVPFKIISNDGLVVVLAELKNIIISEEVTYVVVGLPYSFSGQSNERLEKTQAFVGSLKKELEQDIFTVDEQLTSKLYSKQGVTKDLDKHSATAILETFLAQNNEQ